MAKNAGPGGAVEIEISRDHFNAYLHIRSKIPPAAEEVFEVLKAEKITSGIKSADKLRIFLENMELYNNTLIIAAGQPFTYGTDARIEYMFETDDRTRMEDELAGADSVDFRSIGSIASVRKGDVIARKIPATQGEAGLTVFGLKLPGEWGMDVTLKAGKNVSMSENKLDFIADIDGAPIVSKGMIRVDPVLIIEGDVDYSTGNVVFDGTVAVKGSVLDGFTVDARGDVIVENTIQSARVSAGGDIVVKRGILTRGKGIVTAEGNIYAKFIENSTVECESNVVVENAIMNSFVSANGKVLAMTNEGAIIGGRTMAFDRVACRNLGTATHPTTVVQCGYRFEVQRKYLEGVAKLQAVQKQIKELQKNYEFVSRTNFDDIDRLGEIRGKMMKMLKIQDQMKEELTDLNATRIFNQFAMAEVEQAAYPGAVIFIGDARFNVKKETKFASFKWDAEEKTIYMSSFDETAQGMRKSGARAKTVLVIDDSKAVRKTLRLIVEKMGLRVAGEAEDGSEGVELYRQLRPSLVTCDIAMINMNGVETLKAIKKDNPKARVVMISSERDKSQILDCVMAGAKDYILKPFVPSRVVTVIRSALEN
ncbi:MAG TPA: FapA family protein [bacterium]|nr:FapA family protein [bacterium]